MWTRRQFVTTAGLAGAVASVPRSVLAEEDLPGARRNRQRYTLYLSHMEVMRAAVRNAIVAVDVDGEVWGAPHLVELDGVHSPQAVVRHPALPVLYVVGSGSRGGDTRPCGVVAVYAICERTGELRAMVTRPLALSSMTGTDVAVSPDGRWLLVSAFAGIYSVLPVREDGSLGTVEHALKVTGDEFGRRYPYLHSVVFHPASVAYGSDLSVNRLRAISFAGEFPEFIEYALPVEDAGPTEMALSAAGDALFVIARRRPGILVFPLDRVTGIVAGDPQVHVLEGACATAVAASATGERVFATSQEKEVAVAGRGGSPTIVSVFLHGSGGCALRLVEQVRVPEVLDARRLVLHGDELLVVGLGGVAALHVDEEGRLRPARHVLRHGPFSDAAIYTI